VATYNFGKIVRGYFSLDSRYHSQLTNLPREDFMEPRSDIDEGRRRRRAMASERFSGGE